MFRFGGQSNGLGLLICAAAIFIVGVHGCERSHPERRPELGPDGLRVLLITLDTTRADRIGCYGYANARTPALDGLARAGVRFDQAYCQVALTLPSHASLLTGTYPAVNGVRVNGGSVLGDETPTLASVFKQRGYRTGAFVSSIVLHESFGLDQGFDVYTAVAGSQRARGSSEGRVESRGDETCDLALAWLDESPGAPFFAWVHFYDAHHPYEPPSPYDAELGDGYDGEIAFADAQIQRLLDWLDEHHLRDRTLVVVAGDHGESLGDHEELQHGLFLYGATVRVPLVLSAPSMIPAERVVSGGVQLVSVMPTVLDMMGWPVGFEMDGRSFAASWKSDDWPFHPCYGEAEYPLVSFGWAPLRSIRTERWLYVAAPRPELYDRSVDPGELTNVLSAYPEVASRLAAQLAEMEARMQPRNTGTAELDAEALRALESLGYVMGSTPDGAARAGAGRDPKDMVEVLNRLMTAIHLTRTGDFAEAIAILDKLVRQSPESDSIFRTLGIAHLALKQYAEAEQAYRNSLRSNPRDAERLCGLGDSLYYRQMFEKAIPVYKLALESDPDFAQVHSRLGAIYARRGRADLAAPHFERYAALTPDSPNALCNLANLRMQQNRPTEAAANFKRAIEIDSACIPAHRGLWQTMRMSAVSRAEVVGLLRVAVRTHAGDMQLASQWAWALATDVRASKEDVAEATRLSTRAVASSPNDPVLLDVLAACQAAAGRFPQAMETADRALALANARRDPALAGRIEARLSLYRSGRAYRE